MKMSNRPQERRAKGQVLGEGEEEVTRVCGSPRLSGMHTEPLAFLEPHFFPEHSSPLLSLGLYTCRSSA